MGELINKQNFIQHMISSFAETRGEQSAQTLLIRDLFDNEQIDASEIDVIIGLVWELPDPTSDIDNAQFKESDVFEHYTYRKVILSLTYIFSYSEVQKLVKAITKIPSPTHQLIKAAYSNAIEENIVTEYEAGYILLARVLMEYSKAYRALGSFSPFN